MHPLEIKAIAALEEGEELSVVALGGLGAVAEAAEPLGRSPIAPSVVTAMVRYWTSAAASEGPLLHRTFEVLLGEVSTDFVLMEVVDLLDSAQPLPGEADSACFRSFLEKAKNKRLSALARSAGLEGAFRWSVTDRRRQLRLLDVLLGIDTDDDPEFLRHAAKIMGLAYGHWHEQDIVQRLAGLRVVEAVRADASFELGMAKLDDALESAVRDESQALLAEARDFFQASVLTPGPDAAARLYAACLDALATFAAGTDANRLKDESNRIERLAFELSADESSADRPLWMGSRHEEAICWSSLANTLAAVAADLHEQSWWEPRVVIEDHMLAAYTANRTLLKRGADRSIEVLIRPRIEASLVKHEGQAYQVKAWLRRNPSHIHTAAAQELINRIDLFFPEEERKSENPTWAMTGTSPVVALIDKAQVSEDQKRVLFEVAASAFSLQLDNLTAAEWQVIDSCRTIVAAHPDHKSNLHGRRLYDALLLWTVRFLVNRLEMTQKDDPTVAYLFENETGTLPHEDALQDDYFRWLCTVTAGSDVEATNVGGGRADVRLRSSNERIVTEVKREMADSSFDGLVAHYAGQAGDYQNVSLRLGFLLVLDLAREPDAGTPHLTALVQTREVVRAGEMIPRLITIIKVPGRRKRPSDLTKSAKRPVR